MDQIKRAVDSAAPKPTSNWATSVGRLREVRGELNTYADALHCRFECRDNSDLLDGAMSVNDPTLELRYRTPSILSFIFRKIFCSSG